VTAEPGEVADRGPVPAPAPVPPGPVAPPGRPVPQWVGPLFVVLAVATVPWVAMLWATLPSRAVSSHYRLAWVGFDLLLVAALARTGWAAWHGRDHVELPAVAAATLLLVDAWFDVLTATGRTDVVVAVVLALAVELPLAGLCIWIAANAEQVRRQRLRWALHRASHADAPDAH
jgi:hypothetical protein